MKDDAAIPDPVLSCLQRVWIRESQPAYLIADSAGILLDQGGKLSVYGLQNLEAGQTLLDQLDFLAGLLPLSTQPISLPCVKIGPQTFADIHCFREENLTYIVFEDVTSSEERQELLQQKANDLHLLRNHHTNFTDLLRDLDLVFLRMKNDMDFELLGKAPDWIEHCGLRWVPEEAVYRVLSAGEFLCNFVASDDSTERLKSGPWVETDPQGQEWFFEATRITRGKDKIIVIERLAPYDEPGFTILQKAREQSLEYLHLARKEKALREKEVRNRILLNAVPDWIFKINRDGMIRDLKASMGKNPLAFAHFLLKPLTEIFPEEAAQEMVKCAQTALIARTLQTCNFSLGPPEAAVQFEARVVAISEEEAVLLVREIL